MKPVDLMITNPQVRAECAKLLVNAGYRVCVQNKQIGATKKQVLVVDKPEKEE